ncbi:MAG: four helix bundle protein [Verrucomicrobia bacterium]|nr:four helix bundle protein [Verrucomicrobiota bacterium]
MTHYYARSFKDLRVYQKAREVSQRVFHLTKNFPKEEMYSLTDQFRRPARSVGAQIAETWGKRPYEKHFISKLTDADAEQLETQHWAGEALDCGYLAATDAAHLNSGLEDIGRMLNSMMRKSYSFCGPLDSTLHEATIEYFISPDEIVTDD